jgi:hypothetical protein
VPRLIRRLCQTLVAEGAAHGDRSGKRRLDGEAEPVKQPQTQLACLKVNHEDERQPHAVHGGDGAERELGPTPRSRNVSEQPGRLRWRRM